VDAFRRAWARYDTGRNVIPASAMVPLLCSLPGPQERFEQLKMTRDEALDNDSANSLQSDEMRVYAETQTIGLHGCSQGSIIPSLRLLKVVVTMPRQEILFFDAVNAIGEKIYHAQLVDDRIYKAYEQLKLEASETQVPFVQWYAVSRVQEIFRQRMRRQTVMLVYRALLDRQKALAAMMGEDTATRAIVSLSHPTWDFVLDPIIEQYVKQHMQSAWSAEAWSMTELRRMTLAKRSTTNTTATVAGTQGDTGGAASDGKPASPGQPTAPGKQPGDPTTSGANNNAGSGTAAAPSALNASSPSSAPPPSAATEETELRRMVLDDAKRRTAKSLVHTLKERQVEVEEAPEIEEDTSWMTIIDILPEDVALETLSDAEGPDEDGELAQLCAVTRRERRARLRAGVEGAQSWHDLPARHFAGEHGPVYHLQTLDEVISKRRKELLLQLRAQLYAQAYREQLLLQPDGAATGGASPLSPPEGAVISKQLLQQAEILRITSNPNLTSSDITTMLERPPVMFEVWSHGAFTWKAKPNSTQQGRGLIPPATWRSELHQTLYPRPAPHVVRRGPRGGGGPSSSSAANNANQQTDWSILYRSPKLTVSMALETTSGRSTATAAAAASTAAATTPTNSTSGTASPVEGFRRRRTVSTTSRNSILPDRQTMDEEEVRNLLRAPTRLPTLLESMEQLGLSTTAIREEDRLRNRHHVFHDDASSPAAAGGGGGGGSPLAFSSSPSHTVRSVRNILGSGGDPLTADTLAFVQQTRRVVGGSTLQPATTLDIMPSYALPDMSADPLLDLEDLEEQQRRKEMPKLSFGAMMALTMAAQRFKRRKAREEEEKLLKLARRGGSSTASSVRSKASKQGSSGGFGAGAGGMKSTSVPGAIWDIGNALKKETGSLLKNIHKKTAALVGTGGGGGGGGGNKGSGEANATVEGGTVLPSADAASLL
jgi:hypothetical protein